MPNSCSLLCLLPAQRNLLSITDKKKKIGSCQLPRQALNSEPSRHELGLQA
jgi:hypothetical protein